MWSPLDIIYCIWLVIVLYYFIKIIYQFFHEESLSPQTVNISEIPQNHNVAIERALVMEVVIDIPDDDRKIRGINNDCCICLGEFEQEDDTCHELILSTCRHRFHAACIIPWLLAKNKTCPFCRTCVTTITTYAQVEDLGKLFNGRLKFSVDTNKKIFIISD